MKTQNYPVIPSEAMHHLVRGEVKGSLSSRFERKGFLHAPPAGGLVGMTRFLVLALIFAFCALVLSGFILSVIEGVEGLHSSAFAVSPTVTPKSTITPIASPSASLTPPTAEDEKVSEIRQAIKDKLNQIKEKIEKKAYVGIISEITDSTLTLTNFRGKQRVRLLEDTIIIGTNKKEVSVKDLSVDDKVIALGEPDTNETLEAKRVIAVAALKTIPAKRLIFFGAIAAVNTKTSTLTMTGIKNLDQTLQIKIDKTAYLVNQKDPKTEIVFKNFIEGQKLVIVYLEPAEGKTPIAKTIFLLL